MASGASRSAASIADAAVGLPDHGVTTPLQHFARDLAEDGHVIDDEDASRQRPIVEARASWVKGGPHNSS
jgi:hypothetical protein